MNTIFDGLIFAHYGQAYVHLKDTYDYAENVRAGQSNGLLGAAQSTTLFLTFGLHTGDVHLTIKVGDIPPLIDDSWEEIVEATFTMPESGELGLSDWGGSLWQPVPLAPGTYRARYSARNFREAEKLEESEEPADPIERYELLLWPAPPAPDRILKVTRPAAQYWHDHAQGKVR